MILYIDPGTGSMLFAILVGIAGAVNFTARTALTKAKFILSGGKKVEGNKDVIDYVIFADDKRYWVNFQPLVEEFDRRGIDVTYLTASEDDPAFQCELPHLHAEFAGAGNKAFARMNFLKATIVLSTTPGLDVYQWKRSPEVKCYVHLFHSLGESLLYRMFGIDYYDAVMVGGPDQANDVRSLEQLRDLPEKELPVVGVPYMDGMANALGAQEQSEKSDVPTVLVAPTWGPNGLFTRYGGELIGKLLETGYKVICRPHPQSFVSEKDFMEKIMKEYPASDQLEWNRDSNNISCLQRADVMLSDYSGVIWEFAMIHNKPVIYSEAKFDLSPYDAWWVSQKTWTERTLPRIGVELTPERYDALKETIDSCLTDDRFAQERQAIIEETWQFKGEGAVKAVDYLVAKHDELLESEVA